MGFCQKGFNGKKMKKPGGLSRGDERSLNWRKPPDAEFKRKNQRSLPSRVGTAILIRGGFAHPILKIDGGGEYLGKCEVCFDGAVSISEPLP